MSKKKAAKTKKARGIRNLPAKALNAKQARGVKGGGFNSFANFGDIKGESTDKDHKDWVSILKY